MYKFTIKLIAIFSFSLFSSLLPFCTVFASGDFAKINNRLGLEILKQINTPNQNSIFSPTGAFTMLGVLYFGSRGDSAMQIQHALKTSQTKSALIKEQDVWFKQAVINYNSNGDQFKGAGSIWIMKQFSIKQSFLKMLNESSFQQLFTFLPNNTTQLANRINSWSSQKTDGFLPKIVKNSDLEDAKIVLANVFYFNGKWQTPFLTNDTKPKPFFSDNEQIIEKTSAMMESNKNKFLYAKNKSAALVELPYKDGRMVMDVILPSSGQSLNQLINKLNLNDINALIKSSKSTNIELYIPKFEFYQDRLELNPILEKLGIQDIFSPSRANLSGISSASLFISKILQTGKIKVEEQGTRVAMATVAIMVGCAAPTIAEIKIPVMNVNHPFLFLIRDTSTNTIVFMGTVYHPDKFYKE